MYLNHVLQMIKHLIILDEITLKRKRIRKGCYTDLTRLEKYSIFILSEVVEDTTKIIATVKFKGDELVWEARAIDGMARHDSRANSFYLTGSDGIVGLLYRTRNDPNLFRVVPFHHPLKILPRPRRKLGRKKGKKLFYKKKSRKKR